MIVVRLRALDLFVCLGISAAVFGCGSVGMAAIMAGQVAGCTKIVAIDINDKRLALARTLGATHSLNGRSDKAR